MISACWRGYVATYTILDDILVLKELDVTLGKFEDKKFFPTTGPEINGVQPEIDPDSLSSNFYQDVNLPIKLTGGILIARDFIGELYVHMGFHPAWKFREVHELIFEDGKLIEKMDLSAKMAEIRDELADKPLKPGPDMMDQGEWIDSTFRLDYDY